MPATAINQAFLQKARRPAGLYWDTTLKGFGVRVGAGGRPVAYVFQKSGGRRSTLGRVEDVDLVEARRLAHVAAAQAKPAGPSVTLREGLARHRESMEARGCSAYSMDLIAYEVELYAPDLLDRRLNRIDHQTVADLHVETTKPRKPEPGRKLRKDAGRRRPVTANRVVRHLKAIYNTCGVPFPLDARWWRTRKNREKTTGTPPVRDLKALGAALREIDNPIRADWWRFALITGLRKEDALSVRWDDIDAKREGWLHRPNPKGGAHKAFELPITPRMREIFERIPRVEGNPFVFSGQRAGAHLVEPGSPAGCTRHQMRATWATRAEEAGCPISVMATLLNHSVKSQSITLRYSTPSDETLRSWAERVAESLYADISAGT
ncbi:MAG: integrase family protein [Hyphomonadaceae bacterium]|nr:integrase family protein [Hyphomonadaceae bacterium]